MEGPDQVAELVNRHGRMVFTTAWRIVGEAASAEDVLQTVFLKVLRLKDRERKAVREWGAWLRVLATRCALDQLRHRSGFNRDSGELLAQQPASQRQDPHRLLDEKQKAIRLRGLLCRLPKKDARVFALRFFEELTYDEIADALGLSINQVGVTLHRARKRLAAMIDGQQEPAGLFAAVRRVRNKEERHGVS